MLDSVRDYAQTHPVSIATGLIVLLPGSYLYITGSSIPCAIAGLCGDAPSPSYSPLARTSRGLSVYESLRPLDLRLNLPTSRWTDKPAPTFIVQAVNGARTNTISYLTELCELLGLELDSVLQTLQRHWMNNYSLARFFSVTTTTALPGAFMLFIRNHPNSWAARHQTQVANALHVLALITVANQRISVQDILVATLVMVSFETFQRSLSRGDGEHSAIGTPLTSIEDGVAESGIVTPATRENSRKQSELLSRQAADEETGSEQVEEILCLRKTLLEAKAAEKSKDNDLKRAQSDLRNARETLTETFAEYTSLRDEMKTVKQTIGRDHQAIIYRKDIELFALRKGNEQKETLIKEMEAKLEDARRQHKAALDVKEARMKTLEARIAQFSQLEEGHSNVETPDETDDAQHQAAVQVKLLHIKGRNSQEHDRLLEEKDLEIKRLREDLAAIARGSETLTRAQTELRRAWDATNEMQSALNAERQSHAKTMNKLQEAAIRLDEEVRKSQKTSPVRLPTIDESDKQELEAMFNAAQQDNLRLYTEHEALEKRVREVNARVFTSEQELEALREQLRLEKAINEDMGTARPSLVHRVHYQRMEGQLKDSRDALEAKDAEIQLLKETAAAKDSYAEDLKKDKEVMTRSQAQVQEEVAELKRSITELQATKQQLMLDHERLAQHRTRQRNSTGTADYTSARSSGATLITEPIMQAITDAETPMPTSPVTGAGDQSIQNTPERLVRVPATPISESTDTNRFSMISNDIPPPELRGTRRKSLTLKGLMKKMAGKDSDKMNKIKEAKKDKRQQQQQQRPKTALAPKDKNASMRPQTSATEQPLKKVRVINEVPRPKTSAPEKMKEDERPITAATEQVQKDVPDRPKPIRYYSTESRPKTALEEKEEREYALASMSSTDRPKSRGWGSVSGSG